MKKRLIAAVLTGVMAVSMLAGCGGSSDSSAAKSEPAAAESTAAESTAAESTAASSAASEETAAPAASGEKVKIGVSISGWDDQWLSYMLDCMRTYADELSDVAEFQFTDGQNDNGVQMGQIEQFIADGCDAIIVNPVETDSSGPMVEAANAAGIPIIGVNRPLVGDYTAYCGGDSKQSGEMLAEAIEYADCTPSHSQAIRMRAFSKDGLLGAHVIENILDEEKPNQVERIRIKYKEAKKYIPNSVPYHKAGEYIMKALEFYQRYQERQRGMDAR